MADTPSKIDAAAEKAFAEAADKKTAEAVSAKPVATEKAETPKVEAVKADAPKPAPKPTEAKPTATKPVEAAPAKVAAKKPTAKKPAAKKPAVKAKPKAKAKPVARKASAAKSATRIKSAPKKAAAKTTITQLKETIMATAKTARTTDFSAKAKEAAADIQTRAKTAYNKSAEMTSDVVDFQKGNLEALVESGKILAAGMQDMGRGYVEDAKTAVETVQADVKKIAAIKTPTELFQLQGEIARRNFDAMVATTSKNTETMLKLVNEAFAPVSTRMSLAASKISKAA